VHWWGVGFNVEPPDDDLMELKESLGISRFGDAFNPAHAERIDMLSR
jgi:hypothetical protein